MMIGYHSILLWIIFHRLIIQPSHFLNKHFAEWTSYVARNLDRLQLDNEFLDHQFHSRPCLPKRFRPAQHSQVHSISWSRLTLALALSVILVTFFPFFFSSLLYLRLIIDKNLLCLSLFLCHKTFFSWSCYKLQGSD